MTSNEPSPYPQSPAEFSEFRKQLLKTRTAIILQSNAYRRHFDEREATGGSPSVDEELSEIDLSSDIFLALSQRDRNELLAIQEALDRIQTGTYGECTRCGRRIKAARLRAVPVAKFCLPCQNELEARDHVVHPDSTPTL